MTSRQLLLGLGLAVAAWLAFFADKSPDAEVAEPLAHAPQPSEVAPMPANAKGAEPAKTVARLQPGGTTIFALRPRKEFITDSEAAAEATLFAGLSWPSPKPPAGIAPPPKPVAPPLPFAYLGKQTAEGRFEVYLANGDRVLTVREKAVIDGKYRIEAIRPPTMSLTYLPLNEMQQLSIGEEY